MELNVDVKETYNNKFMALMESDCRPEPDGYFGATFGEPMTIHYAFKLETQPLANVVGLLDIVEDKIVDIILQNAFPQVCGFRRRRLAYAASGVRFLKFEQKEKCKPAHAEVNTCGIFTSQLNVYGREKEKALASFLKLLEETLNPSDPTSLHSELVDMTSMDTYFQVTEGDVNVPMPKSHILGWVALCCVGVIFIMLVWCLLIRRDKQMDSGSFTGSNSKRMWNRFYKRGQQKSRAKYNDCDEADDEEEKSIGVLSDEDGDVLLNANGRPLYHCRSGSVGSLYGDETMTTTSQLI